MYRRLPLYRCLSVLVPVVLASTLLAADLAEKWSKRLESADANYQTAVQKADNVRFYAVQKAAQERVKILKAALADATKAGDFDAATEIKARVAAAETAGGVRPKPKNVVKFGGHEYALIEDKVTWHVAKRLCEEMGGHLATIESPQESHFLRELCGKSDGWAGATDEQTEGDWTWVTGTKCPASLTATWRTKDESGEQHNLLWFTPDQQWVAARGGYRSAFLCEWE